MRQIPTSFPARARHELPGWRIIVRCDQGPVRRRLEDAWAVVPRVAASRIDGHVVAVFDGLGGHPNGQEAAWAAAAALRGAVATEYDLEHVLPRLHGPALQSRGLTTAVVASLGTAGRVRVVGAGDSAAYALVEGQVRLLMPKDAGHDGMITVALGMDVPQRPPIRHELPTGASILLCTDGVDGIVESGQIRRCLEAADAAQAVDDLFARVLEAGCPDNATAILARRTG